MSDIHDSAPTPDRVVPPEVHRTLRRAAERVWSDCHSRAVGIPEPDVLRGEIDDLAALVATATQGRPLPSLVAGEADCGAILDLLRSAFLREIGEGDEPFLLPVMLAFERARAHVYAPGGEAPLLPRPILTPYGHRLLREVAHTLRAPLGSIVMMADNLESGSGGAITDAQRRHLRIIRRAALTVAAFGGDLLALTDEHEDLSADPEPFSLPGVIEPAVDVVRPITEERRVRLETEIDDETRLGRPGTVGRVVLNLLLHTALRSRDGELRLTARAIDATAVDFILAIDGCGDAEAIFRAFRDGEGANGYTLSASGLGMSVARSLVRGMGSDIEVSRPRADGLRLDFTLELPARPSDTME